MWLIYKKVQIFSMRNCYGLNVCVSPKFICENSHPQYDYIWRWGLWEVLRSWRWSLHDGISALRRKDTENEEGQPSNRHIGLTLGRERGKEDQTEWKHLRLSCRSKEVQQIRESLSPNWRAEESWVPQEWCCLGILVVLRYQLGAACESMALISNVAMDFSV